MAHRNVHVYDVRKLEEPKQKRESALKFMTRSVACMADGKGKLTLLSLTWTLLRMSDRRLGIGLHRRSYSC